MDPALEIPFDGIITLLIFLVGIPAIVLQFMAQDVRRVLMKNLTIPTEVKKWGIVAGLIVVISIYIAAKCSISDNVVWITMFVLLFLIVAYTTIQVQYRYGWREVVIKSLKDGARQKLEKNGGRLNRVELSNLIEIGKHSEPGPDREIVLLALRDLTIETCNNKNYHGDALEELIDGLVKMLATRPVADDVQNYQIAVEILTTILTVGSIDKKSSLIDQQHAVRALSALGQTFLSEITLSVGTDHILMDYEETLGLASSHQPVMLTDVTQSLLEVGSVALYREHYLFAVATYDRLLNIVEDNQEYSGEALADLFGLTAHFWTSGQSSREFIEKRMPRIRVCAEDSFLAALEKARIHSQLTMRFDTADKLAQMARDLKPKSKPRRKKK